MKYVYSVIFCGLLLSTQFTALAQIQTGFHYKIQNTWKMKEKRICKHQPKLSTQTGYKIIYSTTSTPIHPTTTDTPNITSATSTTPASTSITSTPIAPPATPLLLATTVTNTQKEVFGNRKKLSKEGLAKGHLKASIKQKGDSLLINFWSIRHCNDPALNDVAVAKFVNSNDKLGKYVDDGKNCKSLYYIPINPRASIGTSSYFISLPYSTWEAGLITIPFKYRFGHGSETEPNQLAAAVNAGVYIGRKWGRTRFYADPTRVSTGWSFMLAAVGTPTVIAVTAENTDPKISTATSEIGYSFGGAALGSYNSFTAGVVGGWDFPATEQAAKWVYAKKFWLGFGVGYKLSGFGDK